MKRWPIIRHIRYFYGVYQVQRWARMWGGAGIGLGFPNPADVDYLNKIWKGEV